MSIAPDRLGALVCSDTVELRLIVSSVVEHDDYAVETLRFVLPDGTAMRGFLTRPLALGAHPALLYAHAHGGQYAIGASELVDGRPALLDAPGPAFAKAGFVTLCIDMPTFGERNGVSESAAAKAALWHGKTLFGQMLGEQAGAFDWLAARPDVYAQRIGMTGISMGATLAYWLAAIEPRIAAIAHLCCYADFATLVQTGAHDLHGHYLTIPGLLAETSTGEISGLVAPRPQLICIGTEDALTPPLSVDRAFETTLAMYRAAGAEAHLTLIREAGVGHRETATMRAAVLAFFARHL